MSLLHNQIPNELPNESDTENEINKYLNYIENKNKNYLNYGLVVLNSKLLFSDEFEKECNAIYNLVSSNLKISCNTMHKYTVSDVMTKNMYQYIVTLLPFIEKYFKIHNMLYLYEYTNFAVYYSNEKGDKLLNKHTDDSDITINICLENTLDKSESFIKFYGARETLTNKMNMCKNILLGFKKGDILIHHGNHVHETLKLSDDQSGNRCNLIIWLKSKIKKKLIN